MRSGRKKEWSILLFVACLIAFMPPVLRIINSSQLLFGIPISYLSMFGIWGAAIVLTAIGARRRDRTPAVPLPAGRSADDAQRGKK